MEVRASFFTMKRRPILTLLVLLSTALNTYAQQDSLTLHYSVEDIVVSAHKQVFSQPDKSGNISINMDALESMPRIGGAVDVVKLLQYSPGVIATEEGNTSLYVRGGDSGQSRMLINGVPLYSPSHLLGFFSVLNSAHLSGLTLYKSGIPAMYGSSTASVTDIRTHSYAPKRFTAEGNIGIIESDIAIQIPASERFGIFLSARHSYTSWLINRLSIKKASMIYEFGDYGVGLVGDLGALGRLTINTHFNSDNTTTFVDLYNSNGRLNWWNGLGNISLESDIGSHITMRNTIYSSIYNNLLNISITGTEYRVLAGVGSYGAANNTRIDLGAIRLDTGFNYEYRTVQPQYILAATSNSLAPDEQTHETALYVNANWRIFNDLDLDTGLRFSIFKNSDVWYYPEPRIMLSLPISMNGRIWASYNFMVQYLHLAPQSNMSFATDFYISSSKSIPPQTSHNLALGYSDKLNNLRYSIELYYRYMDGVIEYNTSILEVLTNSHSRNTSIYSGIGESYGIESNIGYTINGVDLQLNYTLSRSVRQFKEINNGNPFSANSDRRHNLSFLATWQPTPRWSLSATFVYATGAPYTATTGVYISGNAFLKEYGAYNGGKLPDLHHLDLSATYWFKHSKQRRSGINISIYNIYAHKNPLMMSWDIKIEDDTIHIKDNFHTLYTIMPSISWTYKF